jgi:capsular polysaccharide biosynthesis protein
MVPARNYYRAARKVREEGVQSAVESAYKYYAPRPLRDIVVPFLVEIYPSKTVFSTELTSRASEQGRLWHVESTMEDATDFIRMGGDIPEDVRFVDSRRGGGIRPFESKLQPFIRERPFVCEVVDARIVGSEPIGVTGDGEVIVDTITHTTEDNERLHDAVHAILRRHGLRFATDMLSGGAVSRENGAAFETVCMLTNPWTNYYHWTVEHVPKVRAIERYVEATGRSPRLLIPEDPSGWMLELLEHVGVDLTNCIEWTYERATAERLVVPSYPCMTPATTRWVKDRVLNSISESAATSQSWPSRIFISRREAKTRHVVNEPEMMETLSGMGFESVVLEEMSVAEQAALFSNVEVVVAPHGAGLTNMLYGNDITVIELFGNMRATYYRMAEMLGFEYMYVLCDKQGTDMIVGVSELRQLLERVL